MHRSSVTDSNVDSSRGAPPPSSSPAHSEKDRSRSSSSEEVGGGGSSTGRPGPPAMEWATGPVGGSPTNPPSGCPTGYDAVASGCGCQPVPGGGQRESESSDPVWTLRQSPNQATSYGSVPPYSITSPNTFAPPGHIPATTPSSATGQFTSGRPLSYTPTTPTTGNGMGEGLLAMAASVSSAQSSTTSAALRDPTFGDDLGNTPSKPTSRGGGGGNGSRTPHGGSRSQPRIAAWIRSRVSQKKVRFTLDGFDLDLTYITPRIIAMGYPAHGTEYYLRNPIDQVEQFFDERHPDHYRIYNLCSERQYDSVERFHGNFVRFPFDDHNAPTLRLMCDFVENAVTYLAADVDNVIAVHCKAGKGRTGLMVCCLLRVLYPDRFPTAAEALQFFGQQRTSDGAGVTIASQQRYVQYFDRLVTDFGCRAPLAERHLLLYEVVVDAAGVRNLSHPSDFYFTVSGTDHEVIVDSRRYFPRGAVQHPQLGIVFVFPDPAPVLVGDIRFTFYRRKPLVLSGKQSPSFYLWLNTTLCREHCVLHRSDLDKVDSAVFEKSVSVGILFHAVPPGRRTEVPVGGGSNAGSGFTTSPVTTHSVPLPAKAE